MRAAPAFQVTVQRFGVWRGGVGLLAGLALAVILAWLWSQQRPVGALGWTFAALGAAAALLPLTALRCPPVELRWDGHVWQLGAATDDPLRGDLIVMLDLGAWMLLSFKPSSSAVVWLPVQRRGLEAAWHALRCAVYGSRPAGPDDDAIVGR